MTKKIKTTDTGVEVNTSSILVVEISNFSFEVDERYPWIEVYSIGGESKEFVTEIDGEDLPILTNHDDLKIFALNWYFENVEIVKNIEHCKEGEE